MPVFPSMYRLPIRIGNKLMAQTAQFDLLLRRHNELQKALLPRSFSPTGNYRSSTYEKVSGYRILVHAEIEFYFEEITKEIIKKAYDRWKADGTVSRTLVALVAYCPAVFKDIPEKTSDQTASEDLQFRVKKSRDFFNTYIRTKNNGIKEKDILALLLPIGVTINDLDNDLLIALNNFGTARGQIAHSTRAQTPMDPSDAVAQVQEVINHLKSLDEKLLNDYLTP